MNSVQRSSQRTAFDIHDALKPVNRELRQHLFIGHARCGSGFLSAFLKNAGLHIGHEIVESDGCVSWLFAVHDAAYPYGTSDAAFKYKFENRGLFIRNPLHALPSVMIDLEAGRARNFRQKHIWAILGIDLSSFSRNRAEMAAMSLICWYQICELAGYDQVVKIDDPSSLTDLLKTLNVSDENKAAAIATVPTNTGQQKWPDKARPKVQDILQIIRPEILDQLKLLAEKFDYHSADLA